MEKKRINMENIIPSFSQRNRYVIYENIYFELCSSLGRKQSCVFSGNKFHSFEFCFDKS